MNIRRANICPGSGTSGAWTDWAVGRATCTHCHRLGIRVRRDGLLYLHSRRGR